MQSIQDLLGGHQAGVCGSQLDRQRDSVQAPAELRDGGGVVRIDLKAGRSQLGTIQKQADGLVSDKIMQVDHCLRIRDSKRGNSPNNFATDAERLAARGKHRDTGTGTEDGVHKVGAIGNHVFAVVDHKQHVPHAQVLQERLCNRSTRTLVDPQRRAKHPGDRVAIFDLGQVHQPGPVWICMRGPVSHFERQPSLARAPDRRKGHEALHSEKALELGQLIPTTDKRRQLKGEIVWTPVRCGGHRADCLVMRHPRGDLRARGETKLVEYLFDVPLCRAAGDEEPARNLTIGQPSPHEAGDLHLAGCKPELNLLTQSAEPEASLVWKQPVPIPVVLGVTPPPISLRVAKGSAITFAFDPIGGGGRCCGDRLAVQTL